MEKLSCIIVDDEEVGRVNLEIMVKRFCPDFEVLGKASSAESARILFKEKNPDLIFLDIQMPGEDGFTFIESLPNPKPLIVFVTAFEEYAIRAFRVNALDYLLKPIDPEDLTALGLRVSELRKEKKSQASFQSQYDGMIESVGESYRSRSEIDRLVLPVSHGYKMVDLNDIIRLESSINYSYIYLKEGHPVLISRSLKDFEDLLPQPQFCRVHTSHIINLREIDQFIRDDGGKIILNDQTVIPVARRRLSNFKKLLKTMNLMF